MNCKTLHRIYPALLATLLFAVGCAGSKPQTARFDFQQEPIGASPDGFTVALAGKGAAARWIIREDGTAPAGAKVLVQSSDDATSYRFPLCVCDSITARDVEVSVAFKAIAGIKDQAAGIVWRYRDKDNHYVVRANALENNVVMYKMQDGRRSDLKLVGATTGYGLAAQVAPRVWNTLKVVAAGPRFTVYLNGVRLFEVADGTFTSAGRVGLWTKADSVTEFDDLRITPRD